MIGCFSTAIIWLMMLVVSRPETMPLKLNGMLEPVRPEVDDDELLPPNRLLSALPSELTDI